MELSIQNSKTGSPSANLFSSAQQSWAVFNRYFYKHWAKNHSAKALAYCWEEANDFPKSVKTVFNKSGIKRELGRVLISQ